MKAKEIFIMGMELYITEKQKSSLSWEWGYISKECKSDLYYGNEVIYHRNTKVTIKLEWDYISQRKQSD